MAFLNKEGLIKLWDKVVKQIDRKANEVHKHTTEDIDGLRDYATEEYVDNKTTGYSSRIEEPDENYSYNNEAKIDVNTNHLSINSYYSGIDYTDTIILDAYGDAKLTLSNYVTDDGNYLDSSFIVETNKASLVLEDNSADFGETHTSSRFAISGVQDVTIDSQKVNITAQQTIITGDLIIEGTDGIKRQIVFNTDGTIGWAPVPSSN